MLSHGNGPQVGLLALQAAAYTDAEPSTLDVLGAQTQGMIAYVLEQELRNHFPPTERFATILTMVEVDQDDPAFANPTKFVGPVYTEEQAQQARRGEGLAVPQGRRVVAPRGAVAAAAAHLRAGRDPGAARPRRRRHLHRRRRHPDPGHETDGKATLTGVEAVIDKDLASELLAREVDADLFVMATDVDGVYSDWGTPDQRRLDQVTPDELRGMQFPAGSMGPKVEAAAGFVEATGQTRRHRWPRRHRADRRRHGRHPGRGGLTAARTEEETMTTFGVHSEVGRLRQVMVHRPELSLQAADALQPRRAAVRRRAVGRARAVRARPVRGPDARARGRGLPAAGPPRRGARRQRRGAGSG